MYESARWVVATGLAVGLAAGGLVAGGSAAGAASAPAGVTTAQTSTAEVASDARRVFKPRKRFAREFTRRGERDRSTSDIEHVRELQYRLRWVGVYNGPVTGTFANRTYRAVKRFQRRNHLEVTGTANVRTWKKLIPKTVRGRGAIPPRCKRGKGWHICYDRKRNQTTLWKGGKLWNSWLVRGGSSSHPTRVGRFKVFYRDKDHVSSLYDSPMPHSQFFSGGQAFHGSALMMNPFVGHSHGCVNMYREDARQLWQLTVKHRLKVRVYGAWS
jgi:peptidoglycan hydrolase-like protein with peptidoglycan-binding domain